jgi:hypothetical protein
VSLKAREPARWFYADVGRPAGGVELLSGSDEFRGIEVLARKASLVALVSGKGAGVNWDRYSVEF